MPKQPAKATSSKKEQQLIAIRLGGQLFGIPVQAVQGVIPYQPVAPIPLAHESIVGLINVRGRIATACDMRLRLGLGSATRQDCMIVLVDFRHELFALMVDHVGDVLSLPVDDLEKVPSDMDAGWCSMAAGVFRHEGELLGVLDVESVIDLQSRKAA